MKGVPATTDYWGAYYRTPGVPNLPSQFALFVANELATGQVGPIGTILDIGCGNGRDALFFLLMGHRVLGLDQSDAAIAVCEARRKDLDEAARTCGTFTVGRADETKQWEDLVLTTEGSLLVYARFFFHAVSEEVESDVLDNACRFLIARGGALCVEARTLADRGMFKVTPDHFRRFIDPVSFEAGLMRRGLATRYKTAGRGFAKFCEDDADVFRIIATP